MENQVSEIKNSSSKSVIILSVIVVIFILALVGVLVFYKPDEKLEGEKKQIVPTSTPVPAKEQNASIDDQKIIKIAKEKLEKANFPNFKKNTCIGNEEYLDDIYHYCNTLDVFKNNFYNIYSNKLAYNDVFIEYDISTKESSRGGLGNEPEYALKNNKVYVSSCTIGGSGFVKFDKFNIDSKTSDKIIIKYVEVYKIDEEDPTSGEDEEPVEMTLVKENNEWRILKATIVDQCNGTYEIGKES